MKIFDFLNILALVTVFCAVVTIVDWVFRRKNENSGQTRKYSLFVEYARSFFPVFLIVLIIRSFIFQPYRVPTGSLEPTVIPGDLIFVTQYNYGLKIPLWDKTIIPVGKPERGQIGLFHWPVNPTITFVKRVVGVPGDHIDYINKVFYINGVKQKQTFVKNFQEITETGTAPTKEYMEDLGGVKHFILRNPDRRSTNFKGLVVPKGMYMMIGDNRDNSDDSRDWGFVPTRAFIGRAMFVWFNIQFTPSFKIRWDRIGTKLYGSVSTPAKAVPAKTKA